MKPVVRAIGQAANFTMTGRAGTAFRILAVVLLVGASVMRWPVARERSFNPDEIHHVQRGWLVSQGLVPFRDFYDHHSPLGELVIGAAVSAIDPETEAARATLVFRLGRVAGWLVSCLLLASTWRLGSAWAGREVGALGAVFLSGTVIFADKAIEIRPDAMSVVLWLEALRAGIRHGAATSRTFVAGLLGGAALSANLKVVLAAPALLAPIVLGTGSRTRQGASLVAGTILGVVPAVGFLALTGAFGDFVRHALIGSVTAARTISPWRFLGDTVARDPEVAVLGCVGLALVIVRMRRSATRSADATIVAATATPLASLVVMPEPWQQFFLLFLPGLAILAARLLVEVARELATRAGSARLARALLTSAMLSAAAVSSWQLQPASLVRWNNGGQLASIRWLVSETPTSATLLAGWGEPAVFRRPATWRPFHPVSSILRMDAAERAGVVETLADPATRPDVVFLDSYLEAISPRIPQLVREHYEPAKRSGAWIRKDRDRALLSAISSPREAAQGGLDRDAAEATVDRHHRPRGGTLDREVHRGRRREALEPE